MADPVLATNGSTGESGRERPTWEKPLATREMRQKSADWTLAGDAGLLNFLQEFSQRMISKTHEMEQLLNSLDQETKVTNSKVSNVTNDFHMLSNTQFVESRVYDENEQDESPKATKKAEVTKSKEEREAELVSKVTSALNLGLSTLDLAFERVEFQEDSDSEEEDSLAKGGTILEPRDPYFYRPLPLLIGTPAFFSDDYVGLQDVLSEEEVSPEKEEPASEPSSESESEPEIAAVTKPARKPSSISDTESGASDLFPSGEDGEYLSRSSSMSLESEPEKAVNSDQTDRARNVNPSLGSGLLAEELDARLRKVTVKESKTRKESLLKSDTASIHSRSSRKSSASSKKSKKVAPIKKAPSDEDLFGHVEEPNEEDDFLFGRKGGLFAASGKPFDNDSEGLFDEIEPKAKEPEEKLITPQNRGRTKSGKKIPTGAVAVLADGDLFGSLSSKEDVPVPEDVIETKKEVPTTTKTQLQPAKGGLFDDSEDDDDLFGLSSKPKPPPPVAAKKVTAPSTKRVSAPKAKEVDLFASDEDSSDLFGLPTATTGLPPAAATQDKPKPKLPAGAVAIFGGNLSKELNATMKANEDNHSDSSSESGPGSSGGASNRSSLPGGASLSKGKGWSTSVSSNSLFTEDPEAGDLFKSNGSRRNSKSSPREPKKAFLFDDETDGEGNSLFSGQPSLPPAKLTSDLFGDLDEDDSLFAAVTKPPSSSQKPSAGLSLFEEKKAAPVEPATKVEKKNQKEKPAVQSQKKVSLFDEDDGDDDLFSVGTRNLQSPESVSSKTSSAKDPVVTPNSSAAASEKGEDEVDVSKLRVEEAPRTRTTSLFDDEDLLFGGPPTESPEVDLFTPKPTEPPKEVPKAVPKTSPVVGGVSLFGGINPFAAGANASPKSGSKIAELSQSLQSQSTTASPQVQVDEPKRPTPMLKDTKDISVSFDEPVDTSNTLLSTAKDRAKVQVKRRPPTRKARQAASRNSGVDFLNEIPESTTSQYKPEDHPSQQEAPTTTTTVEQRLPDVERKTSEKSESFLTISKDLDLQSPSTEEEDLFSVGEPKKDTRLFIATRNMDSDSKDSEKSRKVREVKPVNIFASDDDDDDIFSSKTSSKKDVPSLDVPKPKIQENGESSSKVEDLFGGAGGEDDIFASVPSSREGFRNNPHVGRSIFDDDDDDGDLDDIFAPRPSTKTSQPSVTKSTTTVKKTIKPSSSVDAFSDPLLALQKDDSLK